MTAALIAGRKRRMRRRALVSIVLAVLVLAVFFVTLLVGNTFYTPEQVIRVMLGEPVTGASFTVGELRLPRATLAVLVGFAFGAAGVTFQTLLRNPLASPDIIGISWGASAAAVVAIVGFSLTEAAVAFAALAGALATAALIYLLAHRRGFSGSRLILIGIGVAAVLQSIVSYMLSRAADWDLQAAMRWLAGSLSNAAWETVRPTAIAVVLCAAVLVLCGKSLGVMRLGDDSAAALGVRVNGTRIALLITAVALLAFATAASGPIAFVAFMAGPVAARLVGPGANLLLPAGLVGALLVLVADLAGQFAFDNRYPVGVITGVLGAPYLIYLLARTNRTGAAL